MCEGKFFSEVSNSLTNNFLIVGSHQSLRRPRPFKSPSRRRTSPRVRERRRKPRKAETLPRRISLPPKPKEPKGKLS